MPPSLLLRRTRNGFGGRKRQLRCLTQHVPLLVREHRLEARRAQHPLTLVGRHGAQIPDCRLHRSLTVRRKRLHLRVQLAHLRFLLRGEVFPNLGAIQNTLLLLRRQAVEMRQLVL